MQHLSGAVKHKGKRRQKAQHKQGVFSRQTEPRCGQIGTEPGKGHHPLEPDAQSKADPMIHGVKNRQSGEQQRQQSHMKCRSKHPDNQKIGKYRHAAGGHIMCQQDRKCGQRGETRSLHCFQQAKQHRQDLWQLVCFQAAEKILPFPACQSAGRLNPQHAAEGKLETDITGGKGLQPDQHRSCAQRGECIGRPKHGIPCQSDQKHNACTQHRNRKAGQPHIKDQRDRLQCQKNPGKSPFASKGKQPAEQRHMKPRNCQQVRNPGGAEGI